MKPKTLFYSSLIAAAAMSTVPAFAETETIQISYGTDKSGDTSGNGTITYSDGWNNATNKSNSTDAASIKLYDSTGTETTATTTWTSANTYMWPNASADVLKGYLDDGGSGVSITVSNISYIFYDVTVIASTDTDSAKYSAITINGQSYTSNGDGNGVSGSDSWGNTSTKTVGNDNSFTVSDLYGDLSLQGPTKPSTIVRGCVAGLIITDTSANFAVNATISANSEWADSSLAGTTWENATSEKHRYANLTLSNNATLNVTGTGITTNAIVATAADGDAKTLTLSGNAVSLIGPGVVRTDSTTANIVINNTLNFESGGKISGNVSTGEGGLLSVSGGAFNVSASETSSLNVSIGEGVSLGISSGTVNITEGTDTISTLTQTGGTLKFSESATATITTATVSGGTVSGARITTANLTGGALSGGNITTANVTSGTVAISGSTIGTLNATGGTVNFSGTGTTTTISGNISVSGGATVEQSAGTVSATRLVLNDSSAKTASFYTLSDGVLNISGDGKQTTSETSDNAILIGHWNSGNNNSDASILTVSGGVLNATSGITTVSWDSAGTLEVSDGEANLYGISLNRYRNYGPATFTLSGGRVNLGAGGLTYGNGTVATTSKTATLSGGTLGALDNWSSDVAISVAGDVAIDTTKMSANTDGKATTTSTGATITLSGNITQTADTTLTVSGAGTLKLSGTSTLNGSVTVDSGATLDLSGTVTLASAISNSGTVKVSSSSVFVLADALGSDNTYTLITNNGGSITDWSTLTISNFRQKDDTAFSARSSVDVQTDGVAKITAVAFNLFWKGGTSGTWNTTDETNTIWGKDTASGDVTAFAAGDNVTFDTDSAVAVTVDSSGVTAGTMTVSAGTITLSGGNVTANAANITAGTLSISSGAKLTTNNGITVSGTGTLKISSKTNIGGNVTVGTGGTFDLNGQSGDVMLNTGFSTLTLAGGKLVNNGSSVDTGMQQLYALTVTADSEVGGTGDFGIINKGHNATTLDLGGKKLTKTGSNTFWLVNTTISGNGGTLEATAGTLGGRSDRSIALGEGVSLKTSGTAGTSNLSISSMGANSNLTLAGSTASTVTISGAVGDGASINVSNGNAVTWTHNSADRSTTAAITIGEGSSFKDNSNFKHALELSGKLSGAGTLISGVATSADQGDGFRSVTLSGSTANFTGTWELETASDSNTSGNRRVNGILNSSDGVFGGVISFTNSSASESKTSSTLSLAKDMEIGGLKGTLSNTIVQSNNTTARALTINTVDGASYDYAGTIASTISSLTKTGAGTQTLSGTLSTTNMTVSEGVLNISGSATISGTFSGAGTLNVNDGGVLEIVGANNQPNQTAGMINVKGGGTLNFSGHDLMGWDDNPGSAANVAAVLAGASEEKVARLNINDSASLTLSRNITMNGNALISTTSSSSFNTYGGKITATGTNNTISTVGVKIRDNFEIAVTNDSGVLEIASPISGFANNNGALGSGGITKTGTGTLILSGDNSGLSTGASSVRRTITVSAGTVVAKTSSALGSTATTVASGGVLKVSVDGGVDVGAGSVTFNENAKFAVDLTKYTVDVDKALTIITASAISFNNQDLGTVTLTSEEIEKYFSATDSDLGDWATGYTREWGYDTTNSALTLTLTVPEPSTFGLLAGVGALALVAARRRRRAK